MNPNPYSAYYMIKTNSMRRIIKKLTIKMNMNNYELETYIEENDLFDDEKFYSLFTSEYELELYQISDIRIRINKIVNDIEKMIKDGVNNFAVFPNEKEQYLNYFYKLLRKEKIKMILK